MDVDQILPTITPGDAVSNECLRMQEVLIANGYRSKIYAEIIDTRLKSRIINYRKYVDSKEKVLIFHYSIGSDISDFVRSLKCGKIMRYHNITPYQYFLSYNNQLVNLCKRGREDMSRMSNDFIKSIADSEFNKNELLNLGYKNVEVLPILINFNDYKNITINKSLADALAGTKNIIFVGKIAPHKAQSDLIKIFYYYHNYINTKSRLILIGSYEGFEKYYQELLKLIKVLNLDNVVLTGKIPFNDLISYYKCADLFLCASEHEGFCVPIIEAMYFDIPILAYKSTAVPFTLNKSGVIFKNKKKLYDIAEMVNLIMSDEKFKDNIIKKEREVLAGYNSADVERKFAEIINIRT